MSKTCVAVPGSSIRNGRSSILPAMVHVEGTQSVLAALQARQRRFEVILVRHDSHAEKVPDVLTMAEAIRQRRPSELDVTMDESPVDSSVDAAND